MLFAFGPEDLGRLAIPIGIGIAVVLILLIPAVRRSITESYQKGEEAGQRFAGKKKPGEDKGSGAKKSGAESGPPSFTPGDDAEEEAARLLAQEPDDGGRPEWKPADNLPRPPENER